MLENKSTRSFLQVTQAARSTALLLTLLTLTTAAVVFWLVAQTMQSERVASKQRWREAAQTRLQSAAARMRESWQQRETTLAQLSELPPPEAFSIIVRDGLADSAVCTGEDTYPALPAEDDRRDAAVARDLAELRKSGTMDRDLVTRVRDALRTYQKTNIPAPQRVYSMAEFARIVGEEPSAAFPTFAAEEVALAFLAGDRSEIVPVKTQGTTLLFGSGHLAEQLAKSAEDAGIRAQPGIGDSAELSVEIHPSLPGWRAVVASSETAGGAGDSRMFALGLTGGAATLLLAALTFLTWRNVRRQMQRAQLQEELAATVSHELRTPVTSMRVLIESLLEEENPGDKKTREYLELVARENARLSRLIENFLTLAKLERCKTAPVQRVTVAEIVERVEPRARLKIAADLPEAAVRVDLAAIEVALHNLIDNACKYSPADSLVELSVVVDGASVRFAIRDHGPGLSPEESARVWLPFERLTGTGAPGCGLGLAIVQRIAAQAGGAVDLQSAIGEGSTFGIILPSA